MRYGAVRNGTAVLDPLFQAACCGAGALNCLTAGARPVGNAFRFSDSPVAGRAKSRNPLLKTAHFPSGAANALKKLPFALMAILLTFACCGSTAASDPEAADHKLKTSRPSLTPLETRVQSSFRLDDKVSSESRRITDCRISDQKYEPTGTVGTKTKLREREEPGGKPEVSEGAATAAEAERANREEERKAVFRRAAPYQ